MKTDKNPWETPEGRQVWKTPSEYFTWLRGALRRIWSDYPLRKVWKKEQLRPVTKEERANKKFHPSTKNVGECHYCKEWFAGSKLECDHVEESTGCRSYETASDFYGIVRETTGIIGCWLVNLVIRLNPTKNLVGFLRLKKLMRINRLS